MIRKLLSLLWLAGFVFALVSIADYWEYDSKAPDVDQMLRGVSAEQVNKEVQQSIEDGDFEQTHQLLALGKEFGHALDYAAYERYLEQHDTPLSRLGRDVSGFAEGFLSGNGNSASGIAGAVAADFTVVGDLRDLSEQYSRHEQGLPVNQLITSLAGVGVGLTALTVGTAGVAAPAKMGASTLKLATRMRRLSKGFQDELMSTAGKAFNWQQFLRQSKAADIGSIGRVARQSYNPRAVKNLENLFDQANGIRKNTSLADSAHLLKYVDNADDLNKINRISQRFGLRTRAVFRLLGKGAVRSVKALIFSLELILSLALSAISGLLFLMSLGRK